MSVLSSSLDALDGFCVLAKSSVGLQCVMIIRSVLKHEQIFVFGELLQQQSIKDLDKTEHQPWLDLLRLFAYGTYKDYKAALPPLPVLSPVELHKLRCLTIVSLSSSAPHKLLPYSTVLRELELGNELNSSTSNDESIRVVEDLIISCMYHGLIEGKLDQNRGVLEVLYAMGRDIAPTDLPMMINTLQSWVNQSALVLHQLEMHLQQTRQEQQQQQLKVQQQSQERASIISSIKLNRENLESAGGNKSIAGHLQQHLDPAMIQAIQILQNSGKEGGMMGGMGGGRVGMSGGGLDQAAINRRKGGSIIKGMFGVK